MSAKAPAAAGAQKRKSDGAPPAAGQRSISSFFGAKPAPPAAAGGDGGAAAGDDGAKRAKPTPPQPAAAELAAPVVPSALAKPRAPSADLTPSPDAPPARAPGAGGDAVDADPATLVGRRLRVWWPEERAFFEGTVVSYDAATGAHGVSYDDGDDESVRLADERVEWLPDAPKRSAGASARGRRAILDSDEEEEAGVLAAAPPPRAAKAKGGAKAKAANRAASGSGSVFSSDSDDGDSDASLSDLEESSSEEEGDDDVSEDTSPVASKKKQQSKPAGAKKSAGGAKGGAAAPSKAAAATARSPAAAAAAKTPRTAEQRAASVAAAAAAALVAAPAAPAAGLGLAADVARFADREAERFPFLAPSRIRDARGRRPDDPSYDPSTLQLPSDFPKIRTLKGEVVTLTGAQEQWWRFKASHFDCVMLFKVGKFYEMFEMDAHIGASVLGLAYMKGEQPHAGFPEKNYEAHGERLARAGHRTVVVEQTETPEQLEARKKATGVKDKVVRREKVAVLTRGTLTDAAMLAASPDASYLVCITETPQPGADDPDAAVVGMAAADCATGRILLGGFCDDGARSRLRAALAELRPVEAVLPRGALASATLAALRCVPRPPVVRLLPASGPDGLWDAHRTIEELEKGAYFGGAGAPPPPGAPRSGRFAGWPAALAAAAGGAAVQDGAAAPPAGGASAPAGAAALAALGGIVRHLRDSLIDHDVLPAGLISWLPGGESGADVAAAAAWAAQGAVALDGAALEALEVLENSEGGAAGSLLAAVDRCASAAGRRRLRAWLCRPLRDAAAVAARQQAVAELRDGPGADALGAARRALRSAPDLERAAARVGAAAAGRGRNAAHVVLYEDAARKRLGALLACLRGARAVAAAVAAFDACRDGLRSPLLRALVTEAASPMDVDGDDHDQSYDAAVPSYGMPPVAATLAPFEAAFDWDAAEKAGRVEVRPGADAAVDSAAAAAAAAEAALAAWLAEQRRALGGGSSVAFVSANKDTHQLEVPDALQRAVPPSWHKASTRKGFTRYSCDELDALKTQRAAAVEAREKALGNVLAALSSRAAAAAAVWAAAADAAAELDALGSLAVASHEMAAAGPVCTPQLLPAPPPGAPAGAHMLRVEALRHPAAPSLAGGASAFVPNDTALGGDAPPVLLLTGPNMGGKSTLLRQLCLAVVLAHAGADVPAAAMTLTAADAVFVRMGARDNLAAGQSTFAVELGEAGAMLRRATSASVVACDELGRGTATHDGAAIAYAVLQHLASGPAPRALFSTHYHRLASAAAEQPGRVALGHMACRVAAAPPGAPPGREEVTFLYRLRPGACPKSYGVHVARLAGLPERVLDSAATRAAALEAACGEGPDATAPSGGLEPQQVAALAAALAAADGCGDLAAAAAVARTVCQ